MKISAFASPRTGVLVVMTRRLRIIVDPSSTRCYVTRFDDHVAFRTWMRTYENSRTWEDVV